MKAQELAQLNEALVKASNPAFYSAVVVVAPDRKSVLLAKRKEDGQWTTPAGGAEWGETPRQTAVRECFEEANILIAEDMLQELTVRHLDNGKVCHCFMVLLPIMPPNIGPHNDPDREVRKWNWHPIEKQLPEPMSPPRRETMIMALMKIAAIEMAERQLIEALQDDMTIQKSKRAPIGAISPNGKWKKVAEGDWRPVSFKPHTVSVKFKHNGQEYTHEFNVHAPTQDQAWGQVEGQLRQLEQKIGKIQVTERHVGMKKSYAENEISGTNIDTTHHAMEDMASRDSVWLLRLKECFADFDLAEGNREMDLDFPWRLSARQGDDGIYDGYVKNRNELDGNFGEVVFQIKKMTLPAMIEALKAKEYITEPQPEPPPPPPPAPTPEQSLLDALRQNLVGTGNNITVNIYKSTSMEDRLRKLYERKTDPENRPDFETWKKSLQSKVIADWFFDPERQHETVEDLDEDNFMSLAEKLEYQLEKARPSFPVGTIRTWGGQKYVKHADGWVAVSGKHHGKMMGRFKDEPTWKEYADEHGEKPAETSEESEAKKPKAPEISAEKEESTSAESSAKTSANVKEDPQAEAAEKDLPAKDQPVEDTPEEQAEAAASNTERDTAGQELDEEEADGEYTNARSSAFKNKGEDISGSARHKAMAWKGLAQAEADGVADKMVKRDVLLKLEPTKIAESINDKNALVGLLMQEALKKFPPAPKSAWLKGWDGADDETIRYVVVQNQNTGSTKNAAIPIGADPEKHFMEEREGGGTWKPVKSVTVGELRKQARQEYMDAFTAIREEAEKITRESRDNDFKAGMNKLRDKVKAMIGSFREKDRYSDTANMLVPFINKTLDVSMRKRPGTAMAALEDFLKLAAKAKGGDKEAMMSAILDDKGLANQARQIVEGKSKEKVFGEAALDEKGKPKKFTAADLYVKGAERKGPETGLETVAEQESFLMKQAGMRGLQWGNSVTDEEREHHLKCASEAFKDLTEILGLPEEMGSFNGRLGLAIGARGKGTALAHYEPGKKVINLTRKGGVGSLAHEWGHFFDNILHEINNGEHADEGRRTEGEFVSKVAGSYFGERSLKDKSPTCQAMLALYKAPVMDKFKTRCRNYLRENRQLFGNPDYWLSSEEMFARSFERYVQGKLESNGRENTYLAGVKDHDLWPSAEEVKEMTPLFDKIFESFRSGDELKKAIQLIDLMALNQTLKSLL